MKELLAEQKFWDLYWKFGCKGNNAEVLGPSQRGSSKRFPQKLLNKNRLGKKILEYMQVDYHNYFLWNVIYKKYMPRIKQAKVLEIGSAPGSHLIRLSQAFGFVPYGVEYSARGAALNKRLFNFHQINPDNVIYADFFSDAFQDKYKEFFDIVISRGFIEDFADADTKKIVEKHINLLSKEGYLFVSIPNLKGIYYLWMRLFDKELSRELNLNIMQKEKFARIFEKRELSALFCDYYGTFNCGNRFSTKRDSALCFILDFLDGFQQIINMVFRLILRDRGIESGLFSPYLLYIGVKK